MTTFWQYKIRYMKINQSSHKKVTHVSDVAHGLLVTQMKGRGSFKGRLSTKSKYRVKSYQKRCF
jgi:hypothetical protein